VIAGGQGITPRQSVRAECARRGRDAVIAGCIALLSGGEGDDELILALGGAAAEYVLSGGEGGPNGYWTRVWAARGLLHEWSDAATPSIIEAATDEAWRVREMAAKVIARHKVGDALAVVAALREDPVPRVRAAAHRAVMNLSASRA
jgi:HEAT repeat protein